MAVRLGCLCLWLCLLGCAQQPSRSFGEMTTCLALPQEAAEVVFIGGAADHNDWTSHLMPSTFVMDWLALRAYSGHFGPQVQRRYPPRARWQSGIKNGPGTQVKRVNYFGYEEYERIVAHLLSAGHPAYELIGHSRGAGVALALTQDPRLAQLAFPLVLTFDPVRPSVFSRRQGLQPGPGVDLAINLHRPVHPANGLATLPILGNVALLVLGTGQQLWQRGHYSNVVAITGGEISPVPGMQNWQTPFHHHQVRHQFMQWSMSLCP